MIGDSVQSNNRGLENPAMGREIIYNVAKIIVTIRKHMVLYGRGFIWSH